MIVDPPSGWRYGFPKEVPDHVRISELSAGFRTWLIDEGYPESEVDFGMKHMRCWDKTPDTCE